MVAEIAEAVPSGSLSVWNRRADYYGRMWVAYVARRNSHLTFWHEAPASNAAARFDRIGPYYMLFDTKANYPGPFDEQGVPLLNYHGHIGRRYNPIAIAQYGLARYNRYAVTSDAQHLRSSLRQARWLVEHLEQNAHGIRVWQHHFDWHYHGIIRAPWYSGLAQGQGISLLARAFAATGDTRYLRSAEAAFEAFERELGEGGVRWTDDAGKVWLEEIVRHPPTHILNGFIWSLWGVYDWMVLTGSTTARDLYGRCVRTLREAVDRYDTGFWSLYDLSRHGRLRMLASPYYHALHVVQLRVLGQMTQDDRFTLMAERWKGYARRYWKRSYALIYKAIFKLLYF